MSYRVVIPARYASLRLPGKPLRLLAGKTMLEHVYLRACQSGAGDVIIATDDARIHEAAKSFNARVCLTANTHTSGTERLAEVVSICDFDDNDIVVNLQGDEPLMPTACIEQVAQALQNNPDAQVSTLCARIYQADEIFDPNIVKVVRDKNESALYFSRAPIPWLRGKFDQQAVEASEQFEHYRHIGLYAYRAGYIKTYVNQSAAMMEEAESLEQLRVLWHGGKIVVPEANEIPGPGVDTEEDLKKVEALLIDAGNSSN
ncbi:3-deoxy-manno-octulosonate cytidylyltransferase [hydrothermal vent metagenome]|uniref:3-deoxy-manno-octulosonate cytidylyltransferase n=1 Tax=hydrothermal vent metagenome TaxID=652676 RepID=A0A3B1BQH0_9ZZZZ